MTNNFNIIPGTPARVPVKQFTKTITFSKIKLIIKQLPLYTSVTFWEATAPVKLPLIHILNYLKKELNFSYM